MTDQLLPGFEEPMRPSDELAEEASEIVAKAKEEHRPTTTFLLFSGGNDSLVLLDAMKSHADAVVHINTGIGIEDTTQFARRTAAATGLPYLEYSPPVAYEDLVLNRWDGLPGAGAHRFTYTMLKERCVEKLLRDHRSRRGERFLILTGARKAESRRRMGNAEVERRNGGQVWLNPLHTWTNPEMVAWRSEFELPVNEVSANLHMSGECLCGAMASQGPGREERAALKFFYPSFEQRLTDLESECRQRGLTYCEWGISRPGAEKDAAGPMCTSCDARQSSLFDPDDPEAASQVVIRTSGEAAA